MFDTFSRATCDFGHCTTASGPCKDHTHLCCCRTVKTQRLNIQCERGLTLSDDVTTNSTHCSCTACDDITVQVVVYIYDHVGGDPISAAQVINKTSGELIGMTYFNGVVKFDAPLSSRNLTVRVQAANYFPRDRFIHLFPTSHGIAIKIALATPIVINASPGDNGYTFIFGPMVFITVSAGGFRKNGTIYNDVVSFNGVYMDASQEGFLDMVDGDQFTVENTYFGLSHFFQMHFTDTEGNEVKPETINYYTEIGNRNFQDLAPILITFHQNTQRWKKLQTLTSPPRETRQAARANVLEAINVRFALFLGQAQQLTPACWLQARTFLLPQSGFPTLPSIGPIVTMIQIATTGGQLNLYRFGSNTGSQVNVGAVNNAICLPLQCTAFSEASVEANLAILDPTDPITPFDFPPNTFNASETGAPTIIGRLFTFQQPLTTASSGNPRPFYNSSDACLANAGEMLNNAEYADFFTFVEMTIPVPPTNESCYIKILIRECIDSPNNTVQAISIEPASGNLTVQRFASTGFQSVEEFEEPSGDNTSVACLEAPRFACISYVCNSIVQVTVNDDDGVAFCPVDSLAPIISLPLLSGDSTPATLLFRSERLGLDDYNDPQLGLYFNNDPMIAREMCIMEMNNTNPSIMGYAAEFNCL